MDARTSLFGRQAQKTTPADELSVLSRLPPEAGCQRLGANAVGLAPDEAARRLKSYGPSRSPVSESRAFCRKSGSEPKIRSMPSS